MIIRATCNMCGRTSVIDAEEEDLGPEVAALVAEIKASGCLRPDERLMGEGICDECAGKKPVN
jgi:hypothetical protein